MTRGNSHSLLRAIFGATLIIALSPLSVNAQQIPAVERLPCTDTTVPQAKEGTDEFYYTGKLIFGRRSCALVKKEVLDFVQSRVSNTMAYYYDGVMIDYTDDGGTAAAPSVGMCRVPGSLPLPICDNGRPTKNDSETNMNDALTRNPHTESTGVVNGFDKCGVKIISADAISLVSNEACFKNRPSPMPLITPGMAPDALPIKATGTQGCGSLRASVINNEIRDNQKAIAALMDRFNRSDKDHKDWDSYNRAQALQAVLDDPQKFYDSLVSVPNGAWTKFMRDAGPGNEYCSFSSRGVDLRTCGKETAWMRGFRIAIYQKHLEKVLAEISQGAITLTNFSTGSDPATYPCGQAALSVENMLRGDPAKCTWKGGRCMSPTSQDPVSDHQLTDPKAAGYPSYRPGIWALEDTLRSKYGTVESQLEGDATKACLGEIANAGQAQAGLDTVFVDGAAGSKTKAVKQISMAACNLAFAHRRVSTVFAKLASCEVNMRVKKDEYENLQVSPNFLVEFKNKIGQPCADYAKDTVNYNPFSSKPMCFRSCATHNFYECYKNGKGGIPSVTDFFYKYSRDNFAYAGFENTGKPLVKKLNVQGVAGTLPTGIVAGKPVPAELIPPCASSVPGGAAAPPPAGGIMFFVFAAGRRRLKKGNLVRRAARALVSILPLLALVAMAVGFTGCGGDDDDDDVKQVTLNCPGPASQDNPPGECQDPTSGDNAQANYDKCAKIFYSSCNSDVPGGADDNLGGNDENFAHGDVFNGNDVQTDSGAAIDKKLADKPTAEGDTSANSATAANRTARKLASSDGSAGHGAPKLGKNAQAGAATSNDKEGGGGGGGGGGFGGINITDHSGEGGGGATTASNSGSGVKAIDNSGVAAEVKVIGRTKGAVGTEIAFGDGHSGGGAGGTGPSNSMSGEGGLTESDEYWGKITGKMTLFQVVSRRYAIWGTAVDGPEVVKK